MNQTMKIKKDDGKKEMFHLQKQMKQDALEVPKRGKVSAESDKSFWFSLSSEEAYFEACIIPNILQQEH